MFRERLTEEDREKKREKLKSEKRRVTDNGRGLLDQEKNTYTEREFRKVRPSDC